MLSRIPLLLLIAASGLHAGAAVNVDPLVAAAAKHERGVLKAAVEGHPLVETYLQYTPKDASAPQNDTYSLGSIDQRKTLSEDAYQRELATKLSGRLLSLAKDIGIGNPEEVDTFAFADMLSPDFTELDGQHYRFEFRWHVFSELVAWRSTMYLRPAIARGSSADDSWAASGSTSRMRSSPATTASSSDPRETRLAPTTSILIRGAGVPPLVAGFLTSSTLRSRFEALSFMVSFASGDITSNG